MASDTAPPFLSPYDRRKYLRDADRQVLAQRAFILTVKVLEDTLSELAEVRQPVTALTPGLVHKGQGPRSLRQPQVMACTSPLHVSSPEGSHHNAPGKPGCAIPEAVCMSSIAQPAPHLLVCEGAELPEERDGSPACRLARGTARVALGRGTHRGSDTGRAQ